MTSAALHPLRVAVLLDSWVVPAWIHHVLLDVVSSDCAEPVLVVLDGSRPRRRWASRGLAFQAYQAADRRFFSFPNDHAAEVDAAPLLEAYPVHRAALVRRGTACAFADADLAVLRSHRPDVILKLGFPPLAGDVLSVGRLGVWSFDHQEQEGRGIPAFMWEILRRRPAVQTCLRATTAGGSRALERSWAVVDASSLHRSRNPALWKSSAFVARALRDPEREEPTDAIADADGGLPARAPNAFEMARFAGSVATRVARERRRRGREDFRWFVAVRADEGSFVEGPMRGFRPVPAPADRFYADPFLVEDGDRRWLFVEDGDQITGKGVIRCLELGGDGGIGDSRVVLERDYHLSYPFVFRWGGHHYMLPETQENRTVELWRAVQFPWRWELDKVLFSEVSAVDPTLLEYAGRLWLFVSMSESGGSPADELFLFHADSLHGEWRPHRQNPVVSDVRRARPAGRFFTESGALYRPGQDCSGAYGSAVWIHRVEALDERRYCETPVRRVDPSWWPGATCTHTLARGGGFEAIDARLWIARGASIGATP
jgi:hypothetical protein